MQQTVTKDYDFGLACALRMRLYEAGVWLVTLIPLPGVVIQARAVVSDFGDLVPVTGWR